MSYVGELIVCWECEPNRWDGSFVFVPITSMYCSKCKKYMDPLDQPRRPLPEFELGPPSVDRPLSEIMKGLGYADPEELRRLRAEEDEL